MLLVVDIGNTNTNIGVYDKEKLLYTWSIGSDIKKTKDEYGILISAFLSSKKIKVKDAIISSVVATLGEIIKDAIKEYLDVNSHFVSYKSNIPIQIKIDNPREIGADRIANASGAVMLYKLPAIIVDIGTATTFDVVSKDACFIGGVIAAGPKIQAYALSRFTSKLPKLKIESPQKKCIAKNTIDAMLAGTVTGHSIMVCGMIKQIEKELGQKASIIATGGFSNALFEPDKSPFDYINKDLTLYGLKVIYDLNKEKKI